MYRVLFAVTLVVLPSRHPTLGQRLFFSCDEGTICGCRPCAFATGVDGALLQTVPGRGWRSSMSVLSRTRPSPLHARAVQCLDLATRLQSRHPGSLRSHDNRAEVLAPMHAVSTRVAHPERPRPRASLTRSRGLVAILPRYCPRGTANEPRSSPTASWRPGTPRNLWPPKDSPRFYI